MLAVAVTQFAPTMDANTNLQRFRDAAATAAARGAKLLVGPEYASGFTAELGDWMGESAQTLDGAFVRELAAIASEFEIAIVAGILVRADDPAERRPYNVCIALSEQGELVASYRKVHLYDAFGASETQWVLPGAPDQPAAVFDLGPFRIGLQTCYDLRFPEVSRRLVDAGANVLAIPAEWVAGPLKEAHWQTLLTARAIENTSYVVAADHPAPVGVGHSTILDARGVILASLGAEPADTVAWLSKTDLDAAREQNPALRLRQYRIH